MVIGTTGWYEKLADMRGLCERKEAGLLYGTNFSIGVQVMMKLAEQMGVTGGGWICVLGGGDAPCEQAGHAFRDGDLDWGDGAARGGQED